MGDGQKSLLVLLNLELVLLGAALAVVAASLALVGGGRDFSIGAGILDNGNTMSIALNLLLLLVLVAAATVILALLVAIATGVPVAAVHGATALTLSARRAITTLTAVVATTATAATTTALSASATSTAATAVIAPAAAAVFITALLALLSLLFLGHLPVGLDALLLALHLDVLLLAHCDKLVVLELGGGLEGQELLLRVLRVKLDEDAALPVVVFLAALAHHDGAVGAEELLELDLAGLVLAAKALDVGAGGEVVGGAVLQAVEELLGGGGLLVVAVLGRHDQRLLALDGLAAGLVVDNGEVLALAERGDDGRVGLEAAHALEGADVVDGNGAVVGAIELEEQVLVGGEVLRREVELDLGGVSVGRAECECSGRHTWARISAGSSDSGRFSNSVLRL